MKKIPLNRNTILPLFGGALCILLSSCTQSRVSRFHQLPPTGAGQTFSVFSARDNSSLEFRNYAAQVAEHLTEYGWRPIQGGEKDDYKVGIHYWMGGDRVHLSGNANYVSSSTEHDRFLVMMIWDKNKNQVFEGRVRSAGRSSDYAAVMPQMIDAMFAGFPGKSGKSSRDTRF
ncbi:MAG: DUF4136 domain-containing protein [Verrucomicrobia bacterium]|nr:DUF4136 domain-containing protein [Verrucomicrobiota bacterium]